MDLWLLLLVTYCFTSATNSFSINDCLQTERTFCFGAKGNDTSYDPRCGCLGDNDCDVLVSGTIVPRAVPENGTKEIGIDWGLKLRRIDLLENQIRRLHFYVSKSKPCIACIMKENSLFIPLDVITLDIHRQKTLPGQPLADNAQVILYARKDNAIEKLELRNPQGSFKFDYTYLKYEGDGADDRKFVTVSFKSSQNLFYEHKSRRIYDVNLIEDVVYPGLVSMIETVADDTNLVLSVNVTTNIVGPKVKMFDSHRLEKTESSKRNPWVVALIVALVLFVIMSCLCCCYCWRRKRQAKQLNKIHANYN